MAETNKVNTPLSVNLLKQTGETFEENYEVSSPVPKSSIDELISASFGSIIPIVYYRMDVILSPSHWLNHIFVKGFIYFTVFFIAYILPPILIALSLQDQDRTKSAYFQRFNIFYANFGNVEVVAIYLGFENLFSMATAVCAFGAIVAGNGVLAVCGSILYHTLKTRTAEIAVGNTLKHQALVGSVTTIILLFMFIIGIICPAVTVLLISNSYRADLMNVTIILGASVVPVTLSVYLLLFKPYRIVVLAPIHKLFKILRRRKNAVAPPIYTIKQRVQ